MLFNSYIFIFAYLPIVWGGFFIIGQRSAQWAATWLAVASVTFYAWWDWKFLFLLGLSIVFNYTMGRLLMRHGHAEHAQLIRWRIYLALGFNLLLLGYFKYCNFIISVGNLVFDLHVNSLDVVLPIGISFFTFTQIAYLVDVAGGQREERNFIHYVLFVTYFPHLIAGPILHHAEMMPQFRDPATYTPRAHAVTIGLTVFLLGLAKKVILADPIGLYASTAFNASLTQQLTLLEAWGAAMAYTMQIYFDFSAYSEMAIGLSYAFNIRLPLNFDSPYKSVSIIDFWRRWHMTLSRFLRDYLYIPLGGSRHGVIRRHGNLLMTMLLGGLWHGAGFTFVVWGLLHGSYLIVNHAWRSLCPGWTRSRSPLVKATSWLLTFLAVVVAWVFFRADDMHSTLSILRGMAGLNGIVLPPQWQHLLQPAAPLLHQLGAGFGVLPAFGGEKQIGLIVVLLAIALFMPNVRQLIHQDDLVLQEERRQLPEPEQPSLWLRLLQWRPNPVWSIAMVAMFLVSMSRMTNVSQFLYFQF